MHEEKVPGGKLTFTLVLVVGILLLLPAVAVVRFSPDFRWIGAYIFGISIITWLAYAHDKERARKKGWRIAESQLHLLEFLGGWPAAFFAQRYLRQKSVKASYRLTFWLIVISHQLVALDALLKWKMTSTVAHWYRQLAG